MQIDKVTVAIRPRDSWEAVDLGLRMNQHWWKAIYAPWLMVTLAMSAALFYLCWELKMLWLYVLLFWWCKPLYSRIPLFVLSRTVFGQQLSTMDSLRAVPQLFMTAPLWRLLFMRLSFIRSFDMPVVLLEGLKGKERRERMQVLRRNSASTAAWLTVSFFLFQLLVYFTFLLLIVMFIPQDVDVKQSQILFPFTADVPLLWRIAGILAFTLSIVLLEPYYIAAGFALYLNRRTLLEGWDIEIAFHRMIDRLRHSGAIITSLLLPLCITMIIGLAGMTASPVQASQSAPTVTEAKQTIKDILQSAEFNAKEKREYYRQKNPRKNDKTNDNDFLRWFAGVGQYLAVVFKAILIILVVMLIVWLGINHARWSGWLRGMRPAPKLAAPTRLFGLDIRPESLPTDIAAQALVLWQAGKARQALSLLYRGALSRLAAHEQITLKESYTEGDCLRVVARVVSQDINQYFTRLTTAWQHIAYAKRTPEFADGEALCRQYATHFEVST